MANGVLVFAEQRDGAFKKATYEALSEGARLAEKLGQPLSAVVIGSTIGHLAGEAAHYGASTVYVADVAPLAKYSTDGYAKVLVEAIHTAQPAVVLAPATAMGKDLAPRVAARLDVGLASDVVETQVENGVLTVVRPVYAGKAFATVTFRRSPAFATLRPNVFPAAAPDTSRTAEVRSIGATIVDAPQARVTDILAAAKGKIELTEASIIVSGGRGIKGPENYYLIQNLADALGGAAGASRAVVDAGWVDHSHQVGQTGKTVSPTLYIACGISGAIQHLAGMSSSKFIVAINKDPEAPIFKIADYGIVGDLFEVVPKLTEQVKTLRQN
ncbi:MAG: electron transfer flavoprotein subunit alpha/FixB family protein [Chloracidobacterium sp.]|uniref:Electron transfer flavoprotein subunit alpha/FixB family protein n=1 Tax=Chloracidobacterium validum TaxID=2821543 RepID=A0ABX8BAA8_9BACT|nr:electron transfer flavoprotein subunit alpha/FixB family protein [Chloracidobacterium validum]QUW03813.1 electron transfer flavoprotein subunit alpha/FixB family protein [Chloracidobacterium validum]